MVAASALVKWTDLHAVMPRGLVFVREGHMERTACCHCGSLRAMVSGEPTIVNVCHCKACQRRTGAAMHTGVWFLKTQVRFEGSEKIYTREVEGTGRTISFHFCPTCGSSVYWHC